MKDLVHDNRVACSGMTLEHSRLCEVEPKISKVCSLRLATPSCPHQVHTFRPLSCRASCFVLSCAASGDTPSGVDTTLRALDFMWRNGSEGKRQLRTASVDQHSFQGGSRDVFMDFFFEHVRRRSRDNISSVQDRPAHPLLLSNSPRWSTTCVMAEAGGLTRVKACFLVAVLVTSLVTQELIRSLGGSGSASVQTAGSQERSPVRDRSGQSFFF